ncbi:MAG: hypothetical protein OQK73_05470 [Gammaproteobacteria bacterium]|nr:hypothetical protein [Gammaproteobacteria bacterium]
MKTFTYILSLLALLAFPVVGHSDFVVVNESVEAAYISVRIDKSLNGTISVSDCAKCKALKLKINPDTKAKHKGKPVHLYKIKELNGVPGTVTYDVKTKTAVRVRW